ncbi:MAG: hypothetical protein PHW72_01315 [Candidatus Pacebacteria bacterium]|nr:hypothetical protein [Candidatus Paceibacterota bacterium]
MENFNFENRILVSITGETSLDWKEKLDEINKLGLKSVAVFLERFDKKERDNFYRLLRKSSITSVPFIHLRDDIEKDEIEFFINEYGTRHFNIHEDHFDTLEEKWRGCWDKIYLEMNFDNQIDKAVRVKKIGGFCIDLSHFKAAISRGTEEAYYVFLNSSGSGKGESVIGCNHLAGYNSGKRQDKHIVSGIKDFDYLVTLPKYVFSKIIAIEVDNSISEQLMFKDHLVKILNDYFLER